MGDGTGSPNELFPDNPYVCASPTGEEQKARGEADFTNTGFS